jgi:hypothetical protein
MLNPVSTVLKTEKGKDVKALSRAGKRVVYA